MRRNAIEYLPNWYAYTRAPNIIPLYQFYPFIQRIRPILSR